MFVGCWVRMELVTSLACWIFSRKKRSKNMVDSWTFKNHHWQINVQWNRNIRGGSEGLEATERLMMLNRKVCWQRWVTGSNRKTGRKTTPDNWWAKSEKDRPEGAGDLIDKPWRLTSAETAGQQVWTLRANLTSSARFRGTASTQREYFSGPAPKLWKVTRRRHLTWPLIGSHVALVQQSSEGWATSSCGAVAVSNTRR